MLADYHDDLAQFARTRWMVHFPPGHSLLYAVAMSLGLSAGAATKALALTGILGGGLGWISLGRFLGASRKCLVALAVCYPWLPWAVTAYQLYETDHVAFALMPWFCWALLIISPVAVTESLAAPIERQGRQLLVVILLTLALIMLKYSMSPIFLATGSYLILLDGAGFVRRRLWWKAAVLGLLAAPMLQFLAVNYAYGPRIAQTGPHVPDFGLQFGTHLINTTISGMVGWDALISAPFPIRADISSSRLAPYSVIGDARSSGSLMFDAIRRKAYCAASDNCCCYPPPRCGSRLGYPPILAAGNGISAATPDYTCRSC